MSSPSITEYTGLLHRHGVDSKQTREYKHKHAENKVFIQRAEVMDTIFRMKNEMTAVGG